MIKAFTNISDNAWILLPRLLNFKPVCTVGERQKTKNSPVKIFDQQENKVPQQKCIQTSKKRLVNVMQKLLFFISFYEGQQKDVSGS